LPKVISQALNIIPKEVFKSRDYLLVYENQDEIKDIVVNKQIFDKINLGHGGVIVTSEGKKCDFVSRFFTSQASILEDPVTGSSHCSLTPFWAKRLNKESLYANQISKRGGSLKCLNKARRVIVSGKAKTYSIGTLWTE
jgi:predicted PhzF superfamily epimerase YddE/YHI9